MYGEVDPEHGEGFEVAGVAEGADVDGGEARGGEERLAVASSPQKKPSAGWPLKSASPSRAAPRELKALTTGAPGWRA